VTSRRPADFRLPDALRQPSFTPRRSDLPALFELLGAADDVAEEAERAIVRLGTEGVEASIVRIDEARPPFRARLARVIGRAAQAGDPAAIRRLLTLLTDPDAKTRRNAVLFLGRVRAPEVEEALVAHWSRERDPAHRRSIAEALGKIGGARARQLLAETTDGDPELRRVLDRARLRLDRTAMREKDDATSAGVDLSRSPPQPLLVRLRCREGLEPILADELAELGARPSGVGSVEATLTTPPDRLFRARTHLSIAFVLPPAPDIASSLASPEGSAVLAAFSVGPVRYRLAFAEGGHRRAAVYRAVQAVAERVPELHNDPTRSSWEVLVHELEGGVRLELRPRRVHDPRYTWRRGDVPAASHPTIAAALARVAGVRSDDVVWDPFVGSGGELVERALLGPYAALHGTDTDPAALAAARQNLEAAGVTDAELHQADARTHALSAVTLIITNPPMGRRVARGDVGPLLDAFLAHAVRTLAPGGRLVWISPLPERTLAAGRSLGLRSEMRRVVDLGGFTGELQRFSRSTPRTAEPTRGGRPPRRSGTKRR
jgi:23S rRNA G2445 N2-methylase RlmL